MRAGRGEDETVGNVTYNLGGDAGGAGATRAVVTHSHVPPRISGIPDIIVGQSFTGKARLSFSEEMHAVTKQHLLDYFEGGSIHVSPPDVLPSIIQRLHWLSLLRLTG